MPPCEGCRFRSHCTRKKSRGAARLPYLRRRRASRWRDSRDANLLFRGQELQQPITEIVGVGGDAAGIDSCLSLTGRRKREKVFAAVRVATAHQTLIDVVLKGTGSAGKIGVGGQSTVDVAGHRFAVVTRSGFRENPRDLTTQTVVLKLCGIAVGIGLSQTVADLVVGVAGDLTQRVCDRGESAKVIVSQIEL